MRSNAGYFSRRNPVGGSFTDFAVLAMLFIGFAALPFFWLASYTPNRRMPH